MERAETEPEETAALSHPACPSYVVTPAKAWPSLDLSELWAYRNLAYFLAWRDTKLQFKQTVLGASWAIIQPLALALVFSFVFGILFQMKAPGMPYLVFFFSGMVPWTLFSQSLSSCANSVVGDSSLIQKIYFPRLVLPLSSILPPLVDFVFAFIVLLAMGLCYGLVPGPRILLVPFFIALCLITSLGVGLWFCAINVKYRDARYLLPLTQTIWMYLTPVFYPLSMLPPKFRLVFSLNPMVGVVEGFRWCLYDTDAFPLSFLLLSSAASLTILLLAAVYFRRCEETFADEL
jgi:lipopolysaccharide transport system permease protein